jgi:hypothetical protein
MALHLKTSPSRRLAGPEGLPPLGTRRLLAVVDHAVQPYNIGDLLIYMTGTLMAAAEAGAPAIDFAFLVDPTRRPSDPIMAELVAKDTPFPLLFAALPILQLNPRLGAFHVFDRLADFQEFHLQNQERYQLWPSREALSEGRYLFYDVFKGANSFNQRYGFIPQVTFGDSLRGWTSRFFQRHSEGRVPVTVNLRNNSAFHGHRNSVLPAWKAFFERCQGLVPVTFIVTCAASELDAGLRACPNVVYAKDHHTSVVQDLALIRHAAFHIGTASGPAAMPIFGASPYHIVHCDMAPHLAVYEGSLVRTGPTELRYAFARELQTFGTEAETAESLALEFDRMWASRDWPAFEVERRASVLAISATG